jgi:hypothetical protein
MVVEPVWVMGIEEPLPTVTVWEEQGVREDKLPGSDAMWEDAPESMYQSPPESCILFRALTRAGSKAGWL